jgi:hypothetical protein
VVITPAILIARRSIGPPHGTTPRKRGLLVVVAALILAALAPTLRAQDAHAGADTWRTVFDERCGTLSKLDARDPDSPYAGLIWCGGTHIDPRELASLAAPILWFSPDEPLNNEARRTPLCEPKGGLPEPWLAKRCQKDGSGIVHYYVSDSRNAGRESVLPRSTIDLTRHSQLFVNYLLYYHQDLGVNPHAKDLEAAQFQLRVECREAAGEAAASCRIRIAGVKGFAHGLNWAANRLKVLPSKWMLHSSSALDTLLPLTLMIEEGKHATCPDRNGDGHYSPGVDVNVLANDAWGVRDSFGSRVLSRTYDSSHTKPRKHGDRWAPTLDENDEFAKALRGRYESRYADDKWPRKQYVLVDACPSRDDCLTSIVEAVKEADDQATPERRAEPSEGELDPLKARFGLWKRSMERLPFAARFERGTALSIQVPYPLTVPLLGVVSTPRLVIRTSGVAAVRGAGLLVSPSVSRWLDWYTSLGWQRFEEGQALESSFVSEFGLRVRFRPIWLNGNLPFVGFRVGVQFRDLHAPRDPHLVIELGTGFL